MNGIEDFLRKPKYKALELQQISRTKKRNLFIAIILLVVVVVSLLLYTANNRSRNIVIDNLEIISISNIDRLERLDIWGNHSAIFLAVNETNRVLVAGGWSGISVWDLEIGRIVWDFDRESPDITDIAISPDGILLAACHGRITLLDMTNGANLRTLEHPSYMWSVAFAPNGVTLASGSENGRLALWDLTTGELLTTVTLPASTQRNPPAINPNRITSLAFSPDGVTLAIGRLDGVIYLWDVSTREITATFHDHTSIVEQIVFDSTGSRLVSASIDHFAIIRNLESGQQITLEHPDYVFSVSFSVDETMIASVSQDGFLRVWNLEDGTLLFERHTQDYWGMQNVEFMENQRLLLSTGMDGIRWWGVPSINDPD
ncbi:MAG: WD40 repeat domain-containing protein [Anaerolineae bacterium]